MRGAGLAYAALLIVAVVLLARFRPAENDLPFASGPPVPELDEIAGLALEPGGDWPAWRAGRARPGAGSLLTLAGVFTSLELADVEVSMPGGLRLTAASGVWDRDALALGPNVRVRIGEREALVSAAARIRAARIDFPGIVVLRRDGREPEPLVEVSFALDDLAERLR